MLLSLNILRYIAKVLLAVMCSLFIFSDVYSQEGDSVSLTISLQKNSFKQYEPVIVLVNYENNSSSGDSVYNIFWHASDELKFVIEDEKGNIYDTRITYSCILLIPIVSYILPPQGVIETSVQLNNYGEIIPLEQERNRFYFNNYGYLSPGEYKAYAVQRSGSMWDNRKELRRSNVINFKVTDIDETDRKILRMEREKKFNEIISSFPDHPYTEHVYAELLLNSNFYDELERYKIDSLLNSYLNFYKKYPDTYYGYNFEGYFVSGMLSRLVFASEDTDEAINAIYSSIKPNSPVIEFLNNIHSRKILYKNLASLRDDLIKRKSGSY